jgi:hypothetical protein
VILEMAKEFASHGTRPLAGSRSRQLQGRVLSLPKREDIQLP